MERERRMILNRDKIYDLPRRYRANLINSILGYKPANLIGTSNKGGRHNLAIFSSAFHLGANPALIGVISRPDSVPRHTMANIRSTKQFTINHISEAFYEQAHQTSAKYDENISEFEKVGLEPELIMDFKPPFVKESPLKIGLELREIINITLNNTYLIIGEVLHLILDQEDVMEDGSINFDKLGTVSVTGLDTYHRGQLIEKLPYARP